MAQQAKPDDLSLSPTTTFKGTGEHYEHSPLLQKTWVWFPAPVWQLKTVSALAPKDPTLSSDLSGQPAHSCYTYIHAWKTLIHT